jgi:S1-C subfamily serine protease
MKLLPRLACALGALVATAQSLSAYVPCQDEPRMATEFGTNTTLGTNIQPSTLPFELHLAKETRWIRVLLRSPGEASSDWTMTIRDVSERPLQSISSSQLEQNSPFWTDRLPANAINFFLEAASSSTTIRLMEYVAMSSEATRPYYSIQGDKEQWVDLFRPEIDPFYRRKGDSIGMFIGHSGSNASGFKVWSCSGFLVANKPKVLFVTNDHCGGPWSADDRWTPGVCENAVIDFSWDGDSVSREYSCKKVVRDQANDLAIIEIAANKTEAPPNILTLRDASLNEEPIAVIHHPASLEKQISRNCQGMTAAASSIGTVDLTRDFAHRCDTEGGSSGAPVLDENGLVVGIHHLGFQKNATGTCDMFNKAVNVSRLIALLKSQQDWSGYQIK